MAVHVRQELLRFIGLVGDDFSKVINEALNLWLTGTTSVYGLLVVTRNHPRGGLMSNAA
jgi:hypothetical protein